MNVKYRRRSALQAMAFVTAYPFLSESASHRPGKKGLGLDLKSNGDWQKKIQTMRADWFYTWDAEIPDSIPAGCEFVPMIWDRWNASEVILGKLVKNGFGTVLGFNVPDKYDQANLTVEDALNLWPTLMKSDLRLGSPACVHAEGAWMSAFMKGAKKKDYRVDFIAMHAFLGANPAHFIERIEKVYKLYKKPIWLTEFCVADWEACADRPNIYSQDDVLKFMEVVIPELEKCDYIERYAWYSPPYYDHPLSSSMLFNADDSLNKLGHFYASV